jgi:methyl-accepting chemotaxis protein
MSHTENEFKVYHSTAKRTLGLLGDNTLLIAIGLSAAVSVILGGQFAQGSFALWGTLTLLLATGAGYAMARGSFASRMMLTFVLVNFITLHIQLSKGMSEFHFGTFVTLALLLVYRDWRPIAFAAILFSINQIVIDRLQAGGHALYCLPHPNLFQVMLHVLYIGAQAFAEIVLANSMSAVAKEGEELSTLVAEVDRGQRIALDVSQITAATKAGMALKNTLLRMKSVVDMVRKGATEIDSTCGNIASGNQDLRVRTEQTSTNLQSTTMSMVELTQTVQRTDGSARKANELAQNACKVAQQGGVVVSEVVETMKGISESSNQIAHIISVIDSIAFQTNILALNASVEAARAGEQGRGFTVVATEVRTLASRSATSANEIKLLINDSVQRIAHGAALVERAGITMQEVVEAVNQVTSIMADLSSTSKGQTSEVEQMREAVSYIDEATRQNTPLVEQMADAARNLKTQAYQLVQTVDVFSTSSSENAPDYTLLQNAAT